MHLYMYNFFALFYLLTAKEFLLNIISPKDGIAASIDTKVIDIIYVR